MNPIAKHFRGLFIDPRADIGVLIPFACLSCDWAKDYNGDVNELADLLDDYLNHLDDYLNHLPNHNRGRL